MEGLRKSSQGLGKGCFLGSFSGSRGDRPRKLHARLAGVSGGSGDLRDQVGVQFLTLVEGYTVQNPLSSHHRCFTHLPNRLLRGNNEGSFTTEAPQRRSIHSS